MISDVRGQKIKVLNNYYVQLGLDNNYRIILIHTEKHFDWIKRLLKYNDFKSNVSSSRIIGRVTLVEQLKEEYTEHIKFSGLLLNELDLNLPSDIEKLYNKYSRINPWETD